MNRGSGRFTAILEFYRPMSLDDVQGLLQERFAGDRFEIVHLRSFAQGVFIILEADLSCAFWNYSSMTAYTMSLLKKEKMRYSHLDHPKKGAVTW